MSLFGGGAAPSSGAQKFDPNDPNIKMVNRAMESCFVKSALAGVMGFGMGGLFGLFISSMQYDTPFHTATPGATPQPITSLPLKQQLRIGFRDMGARSWSMARSFGRLGALYSGIECGIEGFRAKNDFRNAIYAGALTGGIISRSGGPRATVIGALGFAAFSAAIEAWLRSPAAED